jgi:hypothetical protein
VALLADLPLTCPAFAQSSGVLKERANLGKTIRGLLQDAGALLASSAHRQERVRFVNVTFQTEVYSVARTHNHILVAVRKRAAA